MAEHQGAGQQPTTASTQGRAPQTQRTSPTNPFMELRREMDQLFNAFTGGFPFAAAQPGAAAELFGRGAGAVDVSFEVTEGDKEIEIAAEVPGMKEDDLTIELNRDVLTISGEKREESDRSERNVHLSERSYGAFRRSFRLPDTVDAENIQARFDKGVLKVTLPKKSEAQSQPRRIDVKGA